MAKKQAKDEQTELLRTLLIAQLLIARVPQRNVREIASCDMNRVTEVARLMALPKETKTAKGGK